MIFLSKRTQPKSRGGGTDLESGCMGMCRGHDPLFSGQSALPSLPIYIAPLLCPPFSNFIKIFHFQHCFGQNFSSQDANFPNFRSLDPSFFKKNPLPRHYFWKPVWHIPTKKNWVPPPRTNSAPSRSSDQAYCIKGALDKYSIVYFISNSIADFKVGLNQHRNFQLILPMHFHFTRYFVNSILSGVSHRLLYCVFIEVDFEK